MNAMGFLVVDKPAGPTSHDIVARARRATGIKKIGHAGTLDPPATGVLVLALGRATRLIRYVQDFAKEYVADVRFGIATSTLDAIGDELERRPMSFSAAQLEVTLAGFRGDIQQVPPMVSALKVGGRRLHAIAREGGEVERSARPVRIDRLELEDFVPGDYPGARMRVECSKGTYVRVLADEIAIALGGHAHLEDLRRTRVGPFTLEESLPVDQLVDWQGNLLPPSFGIAGMASMSVTSPDLEAVRHGRSIEVAGEDGPLAMIGPEGDLLAVYRRSGSIARAEVVLA